MCNYVFIINYDVASGNEITPCDKNDKPLGLVVYRFSGNVIVEEPAIPLIEWLRPRGLKVCSYVEKYADFKNQTLKKILKLALKWGCTLYQII